MNLTLPRIYFILAFCNPGLGLRIKQLASDAEEIVLPCTNEICNQTSISLFPKVPAFKLNRILHLIFDRSY